MTKKFSTIVSDEEEKQIMIAAEEMSKLNVIDKPTKYCITKFALDTIVNSFKIFKKREDITQAMLESALKEYGKIKSEKLCQDEKLQNVG
jgi:hypothetical protein